MLGVNFAGTAVMESEGRTLQVNGGSETDIANGILRVSQSATQRVCFLDGHGEPDPVQPRVARPSRGRARPLARARRQVRAARAPRDGQGAPRAGDPELQGGEGLAAAARRTRSPAARCWWWRARRLPLLPAEVEAIRAYLAAGGNALFMLDPFVPTGLEPVLREYGIVVDDDIVIDEASHFWADVSAPAVSDYNRHQVTRDLPLTFFPGARSLSPTPRARPRHLGGPARQLVEEQLGADQPGSGRASSRAATCRARTR